MVWDNKEQGEKHVKSPKRSKRQNSQTIEIRQSQIKEAEGSRCYQKVYVREEGGKASINSAEEKAL